MHITVLTLFPDQFTGPFDTSIIKRAQRKGLANINIFNIRDVATDAYKTVDDHPYGGGHGMIVKVDIIDRALSLVRSKNPKHTYHTVLLDPAGEPYTQSCAFELSKKEHLILICGHYEGVDERVRSLVDQEISIGDYVLTGGELPAMVLIDSITRLIPGVLLHPESTQNESFGAQSMLEYPQYTRPQEYKNMKVPDVLLSGNHQKIEAWKNAEAIKRTKKRRADLL